VGSDHASRDEAIRLIPRKPVWTKAGRNIDERIEVAAS